MMIVFFGIAVLLMAIGHLFKVSRWSLYISVYEKPVFGNLLTALSISHIINVLLPVRLGDIFRVLVSGKSLKNRYSFSFATVITDLYIDLITVGCFFFGLAAIGKGGGQLKEIANFYMLTFVIIIPLTFLCVIFRKFIKKAIAFVASIFNDNIEFRLFYISFLSISALKDVAFKINKFKFVLYTFFIWVCYVASYMFFAEFLQKSGFSFTTSDVFTVLFSNGKNLYNSSSFEYWAIFLLVPLIICLIISLFMRKRKTDIKSKNILPQLNKIDRYNFLQMYYSEVNRDHIKAYLEINKDVSVLQDNSAGSNASTVLILKNEKMYYRKYAYGVDGKKLAEQINWIESNQRNIPLPIISEKRCEEAFSTYDMPFYSNAVGLFRYIHTMPVSKSWEILKTALDDICNTVHKSHVRKSDTETIEKYIKGKIYKNLEIIKNSYYISKLEANEKIVVNGSELYTLDFYKEMFDNEHLKQIFKNDDYSDIHGDLTIENIVCLSSDAELEAKDFEGKIKPKNYYFIDPNTGNLHNSPFLDYAKLLQSLHGCYEFLMMVKEISIVQNQISFMTTVSENYRVIYRRFKNYLLKNFSKEQILSIYYHEIVHWLRLMPYKIRKNEKLAVVFYTGLLSVLKDVCEMEHESQ